MKKIMLIACIATLLVACGGKKDSKKTANRPTREEPGKPATTGKDGELTQWLSNKKLVSTAKDPKYDMWNNLQLRADGSCTDKDGASATWIIKDGKFVFQSVINMKVDIEKKAEDTVIFKGMVKDNLYYLAPL